MTTPFERLSAALSDRYRLERELGAGGMATVYLATDLRHEREVAVKVLRGDLAASIGAERFLREIRIAARLQHPHIVPLLDSGEAADTLYYVMPFVPGESLRDRLAREAELPVPDVVRIMRDVADALAFAHGRGVVHRDIKPENILLSGRHALVADFGVAKAVSDATGRNQVTTAGVALGTPAYMAPEQATADPHVDHRADIYALGVVGYEALAGAAPFTGTTPQQVLAAHVTETPRPVTARRAVVPPALAETVMRCLEKKPADRWQTAAELLAQLEALPTTSGGTTPSDTRPYQAVPGARRRWPVVAAVAAGVVLVAAVGLAAWRGGLLAGDSAPRVTLHDRTQLTFSGQLHTPAVSGDGRQLAYVTRDCAGDVCLNDVIVQDIGGTGSRTVVDGAQAVYTLDWSPDRRHLVMLGYYGGRWGTFIVPVVGGEPRLITRGTAMNGPGAVFLDADTLLVMQDLPRDSAQWIRVVTLGGGAHDSIRVDVGGSIIGNFTAVPGGRWIVVDVPGLTGTSERMVLDRRGRVVDRGTVPYGLVRASADALWIDARVSRGPGTVLRTPFDTVTGQPAERTDTLYRGVFTGYSVTADGRRLVLDEGTYQNTFWALSLEDAVAGRFADGARILQASGDLTAELSQDGDRVLIGRRLAGENELWRYSLMPVGGGAEVPLPLQRPVEKAVWHDSTTVAVNELVDDHLRLSLVDVRTGARSDVVQTDERFVWGRAPLGGGAWAWLPLGGDEVRVRRADSTHDIPAPTWYESLFALSSGGRGDLVVAGWNRGTADTAGLSVLSLETGTGELWFSQSVEYLDFRSMTDGTVQLVVWETDETAAVYHLTGPGQARLLGRIPRAVSSVSVSRDFGRAVVGTREYFGDVWGMAVR